MKSVKNLMIPTAVLAGLVMLFVTAGFPAMAESGLSSQVRDVPFPYPTIQEAINAANDGDTVVVHPGTYTGTDPVDPNQRNVDLDFGGKAITVRSEDPDEKYIVAATIIDCQGTASDPHRAFIFQSGEDANSVLAGFTIINGYIVGPNETDGGDAVGGAISCIGSSPTIRNCVIGNCVVEAGDGGNGIDGTDGIDYDPGTGGDPDDPNYVPPTFPTDGTDGGDAGSGGRACGGGIYCDPNSDPNIYYCEITNCRAIGGNAGNGGNGGNGGIGDPGATPPVADCNGGDGGNGGDALARGGGIYCETGSNAIISFCTISNCNTVSTGAAGTAGTGGTGDPPGIDGIDGASGDSGGGLYLGVGYTGTISDTTVSGCGAGEGGGIYCDPNCLLTISGTDILNNTATVGEGGGIYCDPNCLLTISGTDILNNTATADGAGIYFDSNNVLTLEDCNVSQNTATADGGGIYYVTDGVLMLNNCNIRDNNSVGGDGAGIWYGHGGRLTLNNCDVSGNTAGTGNGGGIYGGDLTVVLGATVVINSSTVSRNRAVFGGGICLVETDLTIRDCNVSDNTAEYGGGVYWVNSEASINNCTVSGNSALVSTYCSGGGFYCLGSSATIKDCLMTDNMARGFGGAMFFSGPYLSGGTQEITNCLITDNTAGLDGGGIYCEEAATPKMTNCTVVGNLVLDVDGSGGGLSCYDASVEIVNSIFWDNIARNQEDEWVARYNGPENDEDSACDIATDASGNVYVTGTSWGGRPSRGGTSFDYATVKYDTAGNELWAARYPGDPNYDDNAEAIAVDASGNVYVTGWSMGGPDTDWSYDFATVKYDPAGNELWVARYNGEPNDWDAPWDIAVDASGNVYVTGESWTGASTGMDFATVKYDTNGNELWVALYNGPSNNNEGAEAIAVDASGNVYVTGWSWDANTMYDYATVKYDTAGNELWVARYNGEPNWYDGAYAIALDASGNVYVTGESAGVGTGTDYATVKYDPADGNELWVARYNGEPNLSDYTWDIAVDASGSVYVTGQSMGVGTGYDYATVKYDATDGNELWVARYNGPENNEDVAHAIGVDSAGRVYVTGYSMSGSTADTSDYVTIKYDVNGNQFWLHRYDGPGNGRDRAVAMALDGSDNVYVTGGSRGSGTGRPGRDYWDYATIKYYEQVGEGGDGPQIAVGDPLEPDNPPAIVMLSYSDVQSGEEYVFVAQGCTLSWGEGGLDADPCFIGGYHLSQIEAGDITDSPCVDAGSDSAEALGLRTYTTRTDGAPDADIVDIGYHYRLPSMLCDLDFDGNVDLADLAILLSYWLQEDCNLLVGDCEGADLNLDTDVDFLDYAIWAKDYAPGDETPPEPDPSTWAVEPYAVPESSNSISMTATTAFDVSGVEYRFVCTGGGGHSSGWQGGSTYIDTGLFEDVIYTYKVQARDKSPGQNKTAWSVEASAYIDLTPPTPNPSVWETPPYEYYNSGDGKYYNRMVAVTAQDPSGVEYYFWCRTGLPYHSGWQDSPIYNVWIQEGPNLRYVYKVKTRDKSPHQNETDWSEEASARQ